MSKTNGKRRVKFLVVSTDLSVDIAIDSRSTLGRHSVDIAVDSRSIVGRHSVDIAVDSWSIVGRD